MKRFIGGCLCFTAIGILSPFILLGFVSTAIYEAFKFGVDMMDALMDVLKGNK